MTARTRQPVLAETLARSVRLTGPGVLAAIEATGTPRMRDVTSKAWLVPLDRAADVLAYIEHVQRRPVDLVENWPTRWPVAARVIPVGQVAQ